MTKPTKTRPEVTTRRLCPPVIFSGWPGDLLDIVRSGMMGTRARGAEPDFAAWSDCARLNPAAGAASRRDDPDIAAAYAAIAANGEAAMRNCERVLGALLTSNE